MIVFTQCGVCGADTKKGANKLNTCKITKPYMNNYEPKIFNKTNNLLRNLGQGNFAMGQKIVLKGRVVDTNCKPISNAKVFIWQVNNNGKYPYYPMRTQIDEDLISNDLNSTFIGSGTAVTDNKGEFSFVTVYPGNVRSEAPHVNLRVEVFGKTLSHQTKMYLSTKIIDPKYTDVELNYYTFDNIIPAFEGNMYQFQIVVDNKNDEDHRH